MRATRRFVPDDSDCWHRSYAYSKAWATAYPWSLSFLNKHGEPSICSSSWSDGGLNEYSGMGYNMASHCLAWAASEVENHRIRGQLL